MAVPIFVIHRGNNAYLKYCLYQARYYNPKSEIILIGDRSNNKYRFVRHYHIAGYSFNANLFAKTYANLKGTLPASYVKMWFKKWFILRDFMRRHSYGNQFVYIYSDVLLYCDVTAEFEKFKDYAMTIGIDGVSHCTFFNSYETLEELCDFIIRMFNEPDEKKLIIDIYDSHKSENRTGSIDDMNLILEYKKRYPGKLGDNSIIIQGSTYTGNYFESQGYEFNETNHQKKIYWKDGYPYAKYLADGNLIRLNALHFSGGATAIMHRYYTGKNLYIQKIFSEIYNKLNSLGGKKQV